MVRRYSKPGRVQQYLLKFPTWVREFGVKFLSDAVPFVRGSRELELPCAVPESVKVSVLAKRPYRKSRSSPPVAKKAKAMKAQGTARLPVARRRRR